MCQHQPSSREKATYILESGGVIVYPTDTVYGLGADATNAEAVARVRAIKKRDAEKPVLAMVSDLAMLEEYADLTPLARRIADAYLPGPVALILTMQGTALSPIAGSDNAVGFRIPKHGTCHALVQAFSKPVTSTSVNVSGMPQARTVADMLAQLGDAARHVGIVLDEGELPESPPSTILDVRGDSMVLVREGAVPYSELLRFLS